MRKEINERVQNNNKRRNKMELQKSVQIKIIYERIERKTKNKKVGMKRKCCCLEEGYERV